jgi:hypothetical protein
MELSKPKKNLDCLVYAYERTRTEFTNPPKNIPSSWDSYDTEFGWSKNDYRSAVGDNSQNTVTIKTVEVRAYFPETRKDEFIVQGKGDLYQKLHKTEKLVVNGEEYLVNNNFPKAEILKNNFPIITLTGTILCVGSFSEQFVINEMKKYRRGLK